MNNGTDTATRRIGSYRRIALFLVLLFVWTHRLPAPISEIPESPTPAPTVAPTAKPKSKPKPKPEPSESATSSVKRQVGSKTSRFSGKWVGTMPEVPWGNVATELIVDETGTTMQWQESGKQKGTEKARLSGDTLQATFQVGVAAIWSLTPQADGATARVRLQAFMNDQTAVFHRTVGVPNTTR
jgi:hypothetical protein